MAHTDWLDQNAPAACPAPMTRAALVALRNAGQLRTECPYVVTDHVQNRLVAGTTITMRAVSATKLSEQVEVNTTYDNEAWSGIYDIDRAIVLELTDNRGNVAKGVNGTEVANFDWGNIAYTGSRVENATWTVTYGNTAQMLRVEVTNGASLNTTNFSGSMQDNRIHTATAVNFSGANGSWRYSEWWGGGSFNATEYTGGGDSYYNEFNLPNVNLVGLTGTATFRVNEIVGGSITAQGAQPFALQNANIQNQSIARTATGGAFNVNQLSCLEAGSISHTGPGAFNSSGTQNHGGITLQGAGATVVNNCLLGQSCSIVHLGNGSLSLTRTTLSGGSTNVRVDAGSNKTVTVNDCTLRSGGIIRVIGAVAGGAFAVTTTRVESNSYLYHRGTGTLSITQSSLTGSSGIYVSSGTRSYSMARMGMRAVSRASLTGTGAVTDSIQDIDMGERGSFNISCSGAANSILYCVVTGSSGSISLTGTTGGQFLNRLKGMDGSFSFVNCTANTGASLCNATDAGTIRFNGVATAKSNLYLQSSNGSSININNSTGGGGNSYINVTSLGTFTQSGTAAAASRIDVAQGAVSHNGGQLLYCHKRLTSTLTTGAFNHSNIVHIMPSNRTLTAANTNRGEYVGLRANSYEPTGRLT